MTTPRTRPVPAPLLTALATVLAPALLWVGTAPAQAAGLTVTTTADDTTTDGACSLREALGNANNDAATFPDCPAGTGADTITFALGGPATIPVAALVRTATPTPPPSTATATSPSKAPPPRASSTEHRREPDPRRPHRDPHLRRPRESGVSSAGQLVVRDSTFTGTEREFDPGGAIAATNTGGAVSLVVSGSTFTDNSRDPRGRDLERMRCRRRSPTRRSTTTKPVCGGAVRRVALEVSFSTFVSNTSRCGGAVTDGPVTLVGNVFADNTSASGGSC